MTTETQKAITVEMGRGNWSHPIQVTIPGPFESVSAIERMGNGHWFDAKAKRFFRSRFGDTTYGGRFFVSSEQYNSESARLYTVRMATDDGSVETIGEFQQYKTQAQAIAAIKRLLA